MSGNGTVVFTAHPKSSIQNLWGSSGFWIISAFRGTFHLNHFSESTIQFSPITLHSKFAKFQWNLTCLVGLLQHDESKEGLTNSHIITIQSFQIGYFPSSGVLITVMGKSNPFNPFEKLWKLVAPVAPFPNNKNTLSTNANCQWGSSLAVSSCILCVAHERSCAKTTGANVAFALAPLKALPVQRATLSLSVATRKFGRLHYLKDPEKRSPQKWGSSLQFWGYLSFFHQILWNWWKESGIGEILLEIAPAAVPLSMDLIDGELLVWAVTFGIWGSFPQ